MKKLEKSFYEGDTIEVAKKLLGKILVHKINKTTLAGEHVNMPILKKKKNC